MVASRVVREEGGIGSLYPPLQFVKLTLGDITNIVRSGYARTASLDQVLINRICSDCAPSIKN